MTAQFQRLTARVAVLPVDDVDTDQIIPARFLLTTDKLGLGQHLFADWRYDADGRPRPEFVLNRPEAQGAQALVAGHNFGCGSSREHAPWALLGWGLSAVVARSFADIFRQNALKNGLLPVEIDGPTHQALLEAHRQNPALTVTVDLEATTFSFAGGPTVGFAVDPFARRCLLHGEDELGYLLSHAARIALHERRTGGTP